MRVLKNHIIFFSGGKSSFSVADWVKTNFPNDNIVLYFTDTLWEDEDLYRFIKEGADKLQLPLLTHSMGINPIQLMYKQHVLFNSRIGNCSKILKMKVAADYLKKGKVPEVEYWRNKEFLKQDDFITDATLYFGIGFEEMHREGPIRANWAPFEVCMPLIDEIIDNNEVLKKHDIKQPRLYDMKFAHNNCKGRCVKAGQGHFKNLREKMPELFHELKEQEHYLKQYVSSYHYIKSLDEDDDFKEAELKRLDRCYHDYLYNGKGKPDIYVPPHLHIKNYSFMKKKNGPYQLKDLDKDMIAYENEQRKAQQMSLFGNITCSVDEYDVGGCSCFVEYD